ncbi:MAG: RNA-binding protein [Selenomonadaceae bacterium]|nr:RNA-binding protein [Selenomonadaceae bacterium]
MMALNFQAKKHREMLMARSKNCTVRLGDVSALYPESSVVWITVGKLGEAKEFLYRAFIDKVRVKTMGTLSSIDLDHQNPDINSKEELIQDFEEIYKRRITPEDVVTVIYFSEVQWDTLGR